MRIIFYLVLLSTLWLLVSCSKGDPVTDPQFGKVSITAFTAQQITVLQGENKTFATNGVDVSLPSGKNRFRFYENENLLLDTLFSIEPYSVHNYVMLKLDDNSALKIYDSSLNGLEREALPDSGNVKFSLANFSQNLPSKVNVFINTTTEASKTIQVGQFLNVSTSFSNFQNVKLGFDQRSNPVSQFSLVVKDPITQETLTSLPLTLPKGNSSGDANALSANVFLIYISPTNTATIFMQK